jgi:hydroxypyruvate isomerase
MTTAGGKMKRRDFLRCAGVATMAAATSGGTLRAASTRRSQGFTLKYAPHFGMFRNHAESEIDQIAFMADQGFRALEDNGMRRRKRELQEQIAKAMEVRHMEMGVFVANDGGFGPPLLTTGKAELLERFLANIKESVEVAKRVHTHYATVVLGTVAQNLDMGFQTANVIEALKRAAEICEPEGLILCCEPLNRRDHAGQFLRFTAQSYAIMKAVGSPNVKILFDIYHQQISEGNLIPNIEKAWDEIAYFQVGDNPGRKEPGTGEVNYKNVFKFIYEKGFTGILGMEHGKSQAGPEGELAVISAYRDCDPNP